MSRPNITEVEKTIRQLKKRGYSEKAISEVLKWYT